jgi:hypothetical protein
MTTFPEAPGLGEIHDVQACARLRGLVDSAVIDLRQLGSEPVVVASCPFRFNDAHNDPDWRAVQVGTFATMKTEYFRRADDYEKQLASGPEAARRAAAVLERLGEGGWRELFQQSFGRRMSHEEVLAVVLQDGGAWLVACGSNTGENAAYTLEPAGRLTLRGRPISDRDHSRFDQRIGQMPPMLLAPMIDDVEERRHVVARIAQIEDAARLPTIPEESARVDAAYHDNLLHFQGITEEQHRLSLEKSRLARAASPPPSVWQRLGRLLNRGLIGEEEYHELRDRLDRSGARHEFL